jgi:hypothetical protein
LCRRGELEWEAVALLGSKGQFLRKSMLLGYSGTCQDPGHKRKTGGGSPFTEEAVGQSSSRQHSHIHN